jgi:Ca2+-binding RTX toxin-like protein
MLRYKELSGGLDLKTMASDQPHDMVTALLDSGAARALPTSPGYSAANPFAPADFLAPHHLSLALGGNGGSNALGAATGGSNELHAVDASADPYAGTVAGNGKPIWSPQQAADNLNRLDVNWLTGNGDAIKDGVLTFGFWKSLSEVQNSYVTEKGSDGDYTTDDSYYIANGYFAPFTADQQKMAIQNIGLWDDLIAVSFKQVDSASDADITFGFVPMSPSAGAHTWFPQEEAWNEYYGTTENGKMGGDVWANWLYSGNYDPDINDFEDTSPGGYAWQAITHEIGHSLGLDHPGDYNASDDNDGDGQPDPITYEGDAYFYQDSNQYTIMSYFPGNVTGQAAVNWDTGYFVDTQTPQVHDILAVQNVYGADYTTRAGNTVYGFHSTADRDIFDFTKNKIPVLTIWDGGGKDTLDLSGFNADNIIDINEGAFSSAGDKLTSDQKAYWGEYFGITTDAEWADFFANNGLGPDGRPVDNIAIAYGAKIENAVGGSGNDTMIGNALNNVLTGNGGNDLLAGGAGADTLKGGDGLDTASYETSASGVIATLILNVGLSGDAKGDVYSSIENLIGSNFGDILTGALKTNSNLAGLGGDDFLYGGNGVNRLDGGAGNDILVGGKGNDIFVFANDGSKDSILDFEKGKDKIDLTALAGVTASDVSYNAKTHQVQIDTDHNGVADMFINSLHAVGAGDYLFHA